MPASRRRRFGYLRQLPSKRWQALYTDPDGRRHFAPDTFERKWHAERWLSVVEAQMLRVSGSTPTTRP
jgi:hypothetical protein